MDPSQLKRKLSVEDGWTKKRQKTESMSALKTQALIDINKTKRNKKEKPNKIQPEVEDLDSIIDRLDDEVAKIHEEVVNSTTPGSLPNRDNENSKKKKRRRSAITDDIDLPEVNSVGIKSDANEVLDFNSSRNIVTQLDEAVDKNYMHKIKKLKRLSHPKHNEPLIGIEEFILIEKEAFKELIKDKEFFTRYLRLCGLKNGVVLTTSQHVGIAFMYASEILRTGCLLAHDMGLGKTLQTLALVSMTKIEERGVTLILCPPQVVQHWIDQCCHFFGRNIKVLHLISNGGKSKRGEWVSYGGVYGSVGQQFSGTPETCDIKKHDVVLTHYHALTTTLWNKKVVSPIKTWIKGLKEDKNSVFFELSEDEQRYELANKFPQLDWTEFRRLKSSSASAIYRLKKDGKSKSLVGDVLGFPYIRVVLDEAHHGRTKDALLSTMSYAIRAKRKIAITGTPTYNSINNLWSLFRFIGVPDLCTYEEFEKKTMTLEKLKGQFMTSEEDIWTKWIMSYEDTTNGMDDTMRESIKSSWLYKDCKYILDLLSMYMLKVSKQELARHGKTEDQIEEETNRYSADGFKLLCLSIEKENIPPCYEMNLNFEMEDKVKMLYEKISKNFRSNFEAIDGTKARHDYLLGIITHLRVMCSSHSKVRKDVIEENLLPEEIQLLKDTRCVKLTKIKWYIDNHVKPDEKIVIFAHFIDTVKEVVDYLTNELKIKCISVTGEDKMKGGVDVKDEKCKQFCNTSNQIRALVATHCIGQGVKLTAANHVLLYTPWWTREEDDQCIARAYRITQTKDTKVVRFITSGTIEDRIMEVALQKRSTQKFTLKNYEQAVWGNNIQDST